MRKNKDANGNAALLNKVKKSVYKQAALAIFVILLTVVLLFASVAAWYTNVVHTSGLVFEVASWGFNGRVESANAPIQAAPGDSGNIYLTLQNESEEIVEAQVNVSKETMEPEMRKRLYFYVDTSMTRSGETMERVYINASEGYTYTVFGMGDLTLSETVHNDAQLKWEWVYDVLGYYGRGTENEDGSVTIEEYLRPIVYDYDEATTVFAYPDGNTDTAMELVSIDGVSVAEFLTEISGTDGYTGNIDSTKRTAKGYYPVAVNEEDGTGVWAYLCNYTEIEMATYWDTEQGKKAAEAAREDGEETAPTYTARLTVSAQESKLETTVAGSAADLKAALESEKDTVVQLSQSMSLSSTEIPAKKKVVLDLNGYTLTAEGAWLLDAPAGSNVTIVNGELAGSGITAVYAHGAEVTFNDVTANGIKRLITLQDNYDNNGVDSKVRILNSEVHAAECVVYLTGNGLTSEQKTQLVIEKSTLVSSEYIAISGNGSASGNGNWGTDTSIINSTIEGYWAGIYQPQQNSTMTIINSEIKGNTAIALKGGDTKVIDSTVLGTGDYATNDPAYSKSGFTDTGDGIYVEANYDWTVSVEISGNSEVTGNKEAQAVRQYEADAENASVVISGGKYSSDVSAYLAEGASGAWDGTYYQVTAVRTTN